MKTSIIVAGIVLVFVQTALAGLEHTRDTLETVKKAVDEKKAILVDVRTPEEWDEGHVKDAVSVPLVRLENNPAADDVEKLLRKDKTVYIYCRSGRRALLAGELLEKYGYKVKVLKPGYKVLIEAGFPKADK